MNLGVFQPGSMPLEAQDIRHMEEFDDEVVVDGEGEGDVVPLIEREDL